MSNSTQFPIDEDLSACIDGQTNRSQSRFVVRRLTEQRDARNRWARYHLIGAVLRKEPICHVDLSARVQAALAEEQTLASSTTAKRWLKPVAGAAIAATVAVVAVLGINQNLIAPQDPLSSDQAGFVSQTTPLDRVFSQPAQPVGLGGRSSEHVDRLQRLMLQHQQAARGAGVGTYWPVTSMAPVSSVPATQIDPPANPTDPKDQ